MKKFSKLLSVLLVLTMLAGLGCGAFASESKDTAAAETPDYGDFTGEAGDNAVLSWHEDSVSYISDGEEKTISVADGQYVFLTVGGVNVPMAVGAYDATVEINVVDPIFESSDYNTGDKDVDLSTELFSVIYIDENGVQEGQSILAAAQGGEISGTAVSGVSIASEEAAVSGIRTGGSAVVEVSDCEITLSGQGGNDFMGEGAALSATDGSTLIARNVKATVSGWVRGCTFAGGYATLEAYDCEFICDPGEYDSSASVSGASMSQPPAGLGVYGNARSNNLVANATQYYENCVFTNRNWGCLGVDAVTEGYLTCVGCEINITESGYGAYSIGSCIDTFTDSVFNIHNGVVAFVAVNGTVILNGGTVGNSDRYGIVTHQAMNMVSTIKVLGEGTELNSAYCAIMVKGRSSDIEVGDGATLSASETGILIQAQDNDDTGAGSVNSGAEVNVSIHDTALEGDIVMSMAPTDTAAMNVTFDNATIDGAVTLSNSTLAIADGNITTENILQVGRIENVYGPREDACYMNITLSNNSVWNVTEASYVSSLNVDDSSVVNGTVTECDGYFLVEPAEGTAEEAEGIRFVVNGTELSVIPVQKIDENTYSVNLGAFLSQLGLSLDYNEETGEAVFYGNVEILNALFVGMNDTAEEDLPAAAPAEDVGAKADGVPGGM